MGGAGVFGPRLREAGIPVHTLHMGSPVGMVKGLWRMYRLLRELNPDIVQTWMYHADLIGGVVARLAGIKAVSWGIRNRSEEHTSELQSLMRISYAVFCLKKKKQHKYSLAITQNICQK